jgi:hypothetical protein
MPYLYDMLGDGDGTMRLQQLQVQYGTAYALANYHSIWSRDINDYDEDEWFIELMDQGDLVKISRFMYKLRDIKVRASASRTSICDNTASVDFGSGERLLNLPTVIEDGNYVQGERYDDYYYLYNHAQQSPWFDVDLEDRVSTSTPCEYLDPEPDDNNGECGMWQGGAYATVRIDGYIQSTTSVHNFFDGPPGDSGSQFLGYGYINGPINIELTGRYYPNYKNCNEEAERRTDYLVIGNVVRKADNGGPIYTPGTEHLENGTMNILGVTFAKVRARSTVVSAGASGYFRNDFTGNWEEPEVSSFRYWN